MPFLVPLTMAGATLIGGAGAAVATVASSRSQSGANRRATATQARGTADTLAFEREREATRRAEYDREQAESRTRWEAEERGRAETFVASEEDRLFRRGLDERRVRLEDEQEARRVPYRQASQQALKRLGDLIGLNGRPAPTPWLSSSNAGRAPRPPRTMADALQMDPRRRATGV